MALRNSTMWVKTFTRRYSMKEKFISIEKAPLWKQNMLLDKTLNNGIIRFLDTTLSLF